MSNVGLIIEERSATIGHFRVGRLLPFREKRTVGPFAFIDHMGPAYLRKDESLDVPPHPHIGLATLTYLFEGCIVHRDSLGTKMEINPGEVNWMTAGRGIVHSERTPDRLRDSNTLFHGLQIWVALPKEKEQMAPSFFHATEKDIPSWDENGLHFKLIAGEFAGKKSPVPVYSPLYLIEIKSKEARTVNLGAQLFGESALYILEGNIRSEGHTYEPKRILVAKDSSLCEFEIAENSTVYIFGGEAFPEERFIYWNFVASSRELIENAKTKWLNQEFDRVPGETEFVPLPAQKSS